MLRNIDFVEWKNPYDEVEYIDLEIDGVPFRMDKGDVWNLYCIAQSAFDKMKDPVRISHTVKG